MENFSAQVDSYFQRKIVEIYGHPEIKKVPIEPKIEWVDKEVTYTEYEDYTDQLDAGVQQWVYIMSGALAIIAILFFVTVSPVLGLIFGVVGIGFFVYGKNNFRQMKNEVKRREVRKTRKEKVKNEIPQYREEIVPGEWAIRGIGTGKLKFGVGSLNNEKILTGIDFSVPIAKFKYPLINDEKQFIREFKELESRLTNIPFVLNGQKESFDLSDPNNAKPRVSLCGIEKDIMNHFIGSEYLFSHSKNKEFHSFLLEEKSLKKYLKSMSKSFNIYENDLLLQVMEGQELESVCTHWLDEWPHWIQIMEDSRFDSVTRQVIPEFIQFSHHSQYSSFNFYCPECNKEISDNLSSRDYSVHSNQDLSPQRFSKNTRCHFLLELNAWLCPMCEKISLAPIPLHKSLDEILLPVYDSLMQENKTLREQRYSEARSEEIKNKNEMKKELERMYFDNLNGILGLKDDMEKMQAEIEGETDAINFINDSFTRFKDLQSAIIDSIEQSNQTIKMQIQAVAQKVLADVDRVKDREMELLSRELNELSRAKRIDDERRDYVQRNILQVNREQNQILNEKFTELTSVARQGFANVTSSVNSLEETSKKGFSDVTSGVKSLEETNRQGFSSVTSSVGKLEITARKGFEDTVKSSSGIRQAVMQNNAMQAARNESMGIDPYDDSSILRPLRSVDRGLNKLTGTITGRSTTETHMRNLETIIIK
jgi:hypothetical protein